jgi:hypothetical protein
MHNQPSTTLTDSAPGTTPSTEEVLDFDYHFHHLMNSPEQILKVLRFNKNKIDELIRWSNQLKEELEEHFSDGSIPEQLRGEGLIVTRKQNAQQWIYSDRVDEIKSELRLRMEAEQQNDIARRKPTTHSWEVRLVKK